MPSGTFELTATSTSNLVVALASTTPDVCTVGGIGGMVVTMVAPGTCSITASQAGNSNWNAANPVSRSFSVSTTAQTISFTKPADQTFVPGGTVALSATGGASGNVVTFTSNDTAVCTVSGSTATIVKVGTCSITANQAGNANYAAAAPVTQTFAIGKASQTLSFTSPGAQTYGAAPISLGATASSGLTVSYAASPAGVCTVSGSTLTIAGAGSCTVTASQAGNDNYTAATDVAHTFAVSTAVQTISFTKPADQTFATGGTVALSATGGASGNAVTFTSNDTSVCAVSGSTATMVKVGTCSITANQAGNANYAAAAPVTQTFAIGKASQTLSFTSPGAQTYGAAPISLGATASSGLAVSYAASPAGVCTVSGSTLTIAGAGSCTVTASQAGNDNYTAATDVAHTFAVSTAVQTISLTKPADQTFVPGGTVALSATGGASGNVVTFTSNDTSVCTVSGSTATMVKVGTCSITANQAGNANYAAATPVTQTFAIGKASQTISFSKPADVSFSIGGTVGLSATATSGLPVSFSSLTASVCSVAGSTVTVLTVGSCSIKASQGGNESYLSAADVTQSFSITANAALALSVSATPTSFSQVGQNITVRFTVTNTGGAPVSSLLIEAGRVQGVTCTPAVLAAGTSANCSGVVQTTANDVYARRLSFSAIARGSAGGTQVSSSAASTAIELDEAAVRSATTTAIRGFLAQRVNLLTSNGPDTSRLHRRLGSSTLFGGEAEEAAPTADVSLQHNSDPRVGRPSNLDRSPLGTSGRLGAFSTGLAGLSGRARELSPFERDASERDEGVRDHVDRSNSMLPFSFSGSHEYGTGRFAFAGSLSQLRETAQAEEARRLALTDGRGAATSRDMPSTEQRSASEMQSHFGIASTRGQSRPAVFDVWVEGTSAHFSSDRFDTRRRGHATVVYAGADMVVLPGVLLGVMAEMDWMSEASSTIGRNASGKGWMVGPYVSSRLTPHLYFDARAMWGRSTNTIDPIGAYTDAFDTHRALISAKLTGHWEKGAFRFRPSAELVYFHETQLEYMNTIGISIPEQKLSLGRLLACPAPDRDTRN